MPPKEEEVHMEVWEKRRSTEGDIYIHESKAWGIHQLAEFRKEKDDDDDWFQDRMGACAMSLRDCTNELCAQPQLGHVLWHYELDSRCLQSSRPGQLLIEKKKQSFGDAISSVCDNCSYCLGFASYDRSTRPTKLGCRCRQTVWLSFMVGG